MKFNPQHPPRVFETGYDVKCNITDCGSMALEPDEQITFTTPNGAEYDVTRKSWGFYATPSLNWRLRKFGWRPVLVKNRHERFFLMLVEQGKEAEFAEYAKVEPLEIVSWLDTDESLKKLGARLSKDGADDRQK